MADTLDAADPTAGARLELAPALEAVALARAADLARGGRYDEAEAVLVDLAAADQPSAAQLDLLARIRAQQGRLDEAERLWDEALERAPATERYHEAQRRARRLRGRSPWLRRGFRVAVVLGVLAALAVPGLLLVLEVDELGERVGRMEGAVQEPAAPPPAPAPTAAPGPTEPAAAATRRQLRRALAVPGVRVRVEANDTVVRFPSGLFSEGTQLTRQARLALVRLGRRLGRFAGRVDAVVIGYTDSAPLGGSDAATGNARLGAARADAVAEFLSTRTGVPAAMLRTRGAGGRPPPSADGTAAGARSDRTVAIAISARAR